MNKSITSNDERSEWFAIKTRQELRAEEELSRTCEEVFLPKETIKRPGKRDLLRAVIPHVLFIKTTDANALELEKAGREHPELSVPFWIYRYPKDNKIQRIPSSSIHLLRLLTAEDKAKCEIYNKTDFKENQSVRITGGDFAGYTGHVVRVNKNKHVVVRIEGICLILLPFIHPDFLQPIN